MGVITMKGNNTRLFVEISLRFCENVSILKRWKSDGEKDQLVIDLAKLIKVALLS